LTQDGSVHALTYAGELYRGQPTRVFAYYASPATIAAAAGAADTGVTRVPGIVLVHGGGGRAFSDWAELWARRGYAAIAMDLAGCGPDGQRLPDGGPDQSDETKFRAIDGPVEDQWPYHAVANVILAHSLLRSLPDVDPERTAITGISWGGYLTCIVAGLDARFRVAMPVYGCGFLRDNSAWVAPQFAQMTPEQSARWSELWDPSRYVGAATMPLVFLNGTNDFAYPLDSYAKTCRLVRTEKHFSIQLQMPHGHIFDFPECFLFIDQFLQGGTPLPVIAPPVIAEGRVSTTVESSEPIVAARLHYTVGPHAENPTRPWTTQPLEIQGNRVAGAAPPDNATVWYVDVIGQRKAVVSSEPMVPGVSY
jgi:dienelactone hydrolase